MARALRGLEPQMAARTSHHELVPAGVRPGSMRVKCGASHDSDRSDPPSAGTFTVLDARLGAKHF